MAAGWHASAIFDDTDPDARSAGSIHQTPENRGHMAAVDFTRVTTEVGDILAMLAAQPSAAFFETGVARVATDWLRQRGVAVERDTYGNLLAQAGGNDGPPLVLMAHMDHPG